MSNSSRIKQSFLHTIKDINVSELIAVEIICQLILVSPNSTVENVLRLLPNNNNIYSINNNNYDNSNNNKNNNNNNDNDNNNNNNNNKSNDINFFEINSMYAYPVIRDLLNLTVFNTSMVTSINGYITSPSRSTLFNYMTMSKNTNELKEFTKFSNKLLECCLELEKNNCNMLYWIKGCVMLDFKNKILDDRGQIDTSFSRLIPTFIKSSSISSLNNYVYDDNNDNDNDNNDNNNNNNNNDNDNDNDDNDNDEDYYDCFEGFNEKISEKGQKDSYNESNNDDNNDNNNYSHYYYYYYYYYYNYYYHCYYYYYY